jgi:HJR/Mrr/RecB family endonuclease
MALKEKDVPVSNVSDSDTHWVENRVRPQKQKFGVSHRGAEELTAEWLVYLGEQGVSITQFSSDGGLDVLTSTYCCQVKNYDKKPVSVVEVRALLGTAFSRNLEPLLFTNSKLTNEALAFSNENRIAVLEFSATEATLSAMTSEGEKLLLKGRYRS